MALGLHKKRDFRKPNQEEGITTFHFGVTRKSSVTRDFPRKKGRRT
jgi:hypothetical protein